MHAHTLCPARRWAPGCGDPVGGTHRPLDPVPGIGPCPQADPRCDGRAGGWWRAIRPKPRPGTPYRASLLSRPGAPHRGISGPFRGGVLSAQRPDVPSPAGRASSGGAGRETPSGGAEFADPRPEGCPDRASRSGKKPRCRTVANMYYASGYSIRLRLPPPPETRTRPNYGVSRL
jgi:hypothetical protein